MEKTEEMKNEQNSVISPDNQNKKNSKKIFSIKKFPKSYPSQKSDEIKFLTGQNHNRKKNINLSGPLKGEKDPEKQLLYYFKDKKIYIEIFNGNINSSSTFYNILLKYKIIQCKKLAKKIDYIVFKDGHLKTKKYAALNGIKMVNPLWIDDKVNNHIFKDDEEYEIKTNFGDIVLREKYEKNKITEEEEIKKDNSLTENKNFELELEAEYDTEYANMVDKMRENNSQKNEISVLSTINITNKEEETESIKKENINLNNMNIEINLDKGIKRQKRRTSKSRQSLIISNENQSNLFKESNNITKMNNKENPKKGAKKNKKKLSEKEQISPGNNKQKKIDICENNFILNFSPDNNNLLTLAKKSEENNIKKTTEKINIITYKLDPKEIQCLQSLNNFEFKGNIDNKNETQKNKSLYDSANIIILEKEKYIYDWKIYEFLFDKKIIIDFTLFLFEFINGDNATYDNVDDLVKKINEISINNEIYFFNKKMRYQKRSMMQSLNIVDNIISKEKGEQNNQQTNEIDLKFYFLLNQDIPEEEKKVIQKLLKNYLKANIININIPKRRPKSVTSQININLNKIEKKSKKNINLDVIKEQENCEIKNDENKIQEEKQEINNDKSINEKSDKINNNNNDQKIEGTYLISKDKVNSIKFLKKVKYYKGVISIKYVYDSFINGQLLDLNDKNIFEKYQLQ